MDIKYRSNVPGHVIEVDVEGMRVCDGLVVDAGHDEGLIEVQCSLGKDTFLWGQLLQGGLRRSDNVEIVRNSDDWGKFNLEVVLSKR